MLACSPSAQSDTIKDGDLVVVYESYASMKAVAVSAKGQFNNRFGSFAMSDWIGRQFGTRVYCKPPARGWVYLVAPTPELWSLVLRHRTQILYVADISLVCSYLDLRPGSVVLESGTGSGSLTHSLARAVAPTGHVHTFEFHELRCQEATREFAAHGLAPYVTCRLRDIEGGGFPAELHGRADGIFLDLPGPWKVVPSAAACLRPDGRLCSFSPCIEQVQRTCLALDQHGFADIATYECLLRVHEVHGEVMQTGFPPPLKPEGEGEAQQAQAEQQQAQQGQQEGEGQAGAAGAGGAGAAVSRQQAQRQQREREQQQWERDNPPQQRLPTERFVVTKPAMEAKGHTGYLTFARKFVA